MSGDPIKIEQGPHLTVEMRIDRKAGIIELRPVGWLHEGFDYAKLVKNLEKFGPNEVRFDLGALTQINSSGVRLWAKFLEELQSTLLDWVKYRFTSVNGVFMEVANQYPLALGKKGTPVDAVEVPYFCKKCRIRFFRTLPLDPPPFNRAGKLVLAKTEPCEKCGTRAKFDDLESEFFSFLRPA